MKAGFIGLGIMGSRMAANLLKGGTELVVYNRTGEKAGQLVKKGALSESSPAGAAKRVKFLFTMLSDPEAVRETAFGEKGFLGSLPKGALWTDCSAVYEFLRGRARPA